MAVAFRRWCVLTAVLLLVSATPTRAEIYRWDNDQLIPGTEGIEPGPGVTLSSMDLQFASLERRDLTGVDFESSNLRRAWLNGSTLSGADLIGADLTNASLRYATLTEANLTGSNFTSADLDRATLTEASDSEHRPGHRTLRRQPHR